MNEKIWFYAKEKNLKIVLLSLRSLNLAVHPNVHHIYLQTNKKAIKIETVLERCLLQKDAVELLMWATLKLKMSPLSRRRVAQPMTS